MHNLIGHFVNTIDTPALVTGLNMMALNLHNVMIGVRGGLLRVWWSASSMLMRAVR